MLITEAQTAERAEAFVVEMPLALNFQNARLTDEQFYNLCESTDDMRFEMSSEGELILAPPTGPDTGWRNSDLNYEVVRWSRKNGKGIVFDSNSIFTFPNGAKRAPDVSWMSREKWDALSPSDRKGHSRVVPDFVIELLSPTDRVKAAQKKMAEYISNGVKLGWLIDPMNETVHIYRANGEVEILDDPEMLSGEDILPGFELNVRAIW